jgi:hypothetical protein
MPVSRVHDTISDTNGDRLTVHKQGDKTYYDYSNGAEVVAEKTEEGTPGKLREVRTISRTKGPRRYWYAK